MNSPTMNQSTTNDIPKNSSSWKKWILIGVVVVILIVVVLYFTVLSKSKPIDPKIGYYYIQLDGKQIYMKITKPSTRFKAELGSIVPDSGTLGSVEFDSLPTSLTVTQTGTTITCTIDSFDETTNTIKIVSNSQNSNETPPPPVTLSYYDVTKALLTAGSYKPDAGIPISITTDEFGMITLTITSVPPKSFLPCMLPVPFGTNVSITEIGSNSITLASYGTSSIYRKV